ncbi:hypothetical protein ACH5RR_026895 [Cinchona calisaya]|uniref:Uncharacterized protein n=1 Tax=Cinchona calisaya TaxID=153742 RepID=A0ABD2Z4X2_9GENT
MGSTALLEKKPHAVCIPYPAEGHIKPMLKYRGPDALNGLPDFQFKTIPDGLPPSDVLDATQDIPSLCESTSTHCLSPFKDLLANLNDYSSSKVPQVSCVVSDGAMSFTLAAAQEFRHP